MAYQIGINGFGRIGRVALRIIEERRKQGSFKGRVVAINDLANTDELAYLLKYDSVHRRFNGHIAIDGEQIVINGEKVRTLAHKDPSEIPWKDLGVDVVLESTGLFLKPELAQKHLTAGAKKVLLSAPASGKVDATICYGVNTSDYHKNMTIISTASCTTNCIAPVAKVLHENLTIKNASVTTIHSYTNDQRILDFPHKDKRRSRAAALSMIPTTTGAAEAVALVMPELQGRFQGMAVRVPTPNVSLIDMVCHVEKSTSASEVNSFLKEAAEGKFRGIMEYCHEPLVSVDMLGTNSSSIIDSLCTQVVGGTLVKVLAWYDNEWGFTNRAVDMLELLGTVEEF